MLDHIFKAFRRTFSSEKKNQASAFWNAWQDNRNNSASGYIDWGDHPTILKLIYTNTFGSSDITVFDFLRSTYPTFQHGKALSLCSGDGVFEKLLVAQGVFDAVVGMDLAPIRVEAANSARGELRDKLKYVVANANKGDFGKHTYDIVFAKAALHHIEQLETLQHGIKRCLRPGGHLVTIDFFGPTRFQWTDAQLAAVNRFLAEEMPPQLRRRPDGSLHDKVMRPTLQQMIELDPSEAVRSSELHTWIHDNFTVTHDFPIGGTLLGLIFDGSILNNFDPENTEHNRIIEKAFGLERQLMERGEIGCDFRFIVAR